MQAISQHLPSVVLSNINVAWILIGFVVIAAIIIFLGGSRWGKHAQKVETLHAVAIHTLAAHAAGHAVGGSEAIASHVTRMVGKGVLATEKRTKQIVAEGLAHTDEGFLHMQQHIDGGFEGVHHGLEHEIQQLGGKPVASPAAGKSPNRAASGKGAAKSNTTGK